MGKRRYAKGRCGSLFGGEFDQGIFNMMNSLCLSCLALEAGGIRNGARREGPAIASAGRRSKDSSAVRFWHRSRNTRSQTIWARRTRSSPGRTATSGSPRTMRCRTPSAGSPRRGQITEFKIPTDGSNPFGITVGPDKNLWFTEEFGNNIGRITPSGQITEFPIAAPTASAGSRRESRPVPMATSGSPRTSITRSPR